MRKILEKSFQNPSKIKLKSIENQRKIKKTIKKCHDDVRGPKNAKKMRKNAKNDPTWPQEPPKRRGIIFPGGLREGLSADHLSWENGLRASGFTSPHAGGRTPAHCLRFSNPAEAATNFEHPLILRTWLGSARNFGKTRFGRFATFDCLRPIFFSDFVFWFSVIFNRSWSS